MRIGHLPKVLTCGVLGVSLASVCRAEDGVRLYVGAVGGISTLSADARSILSATDFAVSLYKPENGPALNLLVGAHLHDYVTIQANYIWNRNDLTLVAIDSAGASSSVYEQRRNSSQHAVVGDLLAYFRPLSSHIRPYLSVGAGIVRLASRRVETIHARGTGPPGPEFTATRATLRVAVGLDLEIGGEWSARYSFSESLSGNPISARLSPPGERNLANFQNLFGIVRAF